MRFNKANGKKIVNRVFCSKCGWYDDDVATVKHCNGAKLILLKGSESEVENETGLILSEMMEKRLNEIHIQ